MFRASGFEHAGQDADCELDLQATPAVRARAQCVPDHALEPADVGLNQGTPVVA